MLSETALSIRGGAYAFQTERDHEELLGRIAKVRLAKTMKLQGRALDRVNWGALDERTADAELLRIGGINPQRDDAAVRPRLHDNLTAEEFDVVLEPKDSWEQLGRESTCMRYEHEHVYRE